MARVAVPQDLVWLDDAAREIGKHPATLRRWVQAGLLKTYKKALDRRVYVDREALDELRRNPPVEEG